MSKYDRTFYSVESCLKFIIDEFSLCSGDMIKFKNETDDPYNEEITVVEVYNSCQDLMASYKISD